MLTLTSDHPSRKEHFERKLKARIYPSGKVFEKQEEEFIEFKLKKK